MLTPMLTANRFQRIFVAF